MKDWTETTLGNLCSINIGGTPSRNNPLFWDNNKEELNHWVSIRDLNKKKISSTDERITSLGVRKSNAKLVKKGTVLLSFKLTIGKVAYADADLYTNEAIAALETDKIDNDFLFQGLQSWDLLQDVDQAIKGATLNKEKLNKISIKIPTSKTEQKRIAEILSTADEAIEQTRSLIDKYNRIKRGLMQDLLTRGIDADGNIRSKQTHKFTVKNGIEVPDDWEIEPLKSSIISIDAGKSPDCMSRPAGAGEWGILKVSAIHPNGFRKNENKAITNDKYINKAYEVRDKDFLISRSNTYELVGLTCLVRNPPPQLMICDKTLRINLDKDKLEVDFLAQISQMKLFRSQIEINATGSSGTMKNITQDTIANILIPFPDIKEQREISLSLDKITNHIQIEKKKLAKIQAIKKGLMQDLLSGKKRVKSENENGA